MRIVVVRKGTQEVQTKGEVYIMDEDDRERHRCFSLELPWRNNIQSVSCIPEGKYKAIKTVSDKFGDCIWIMQVPGRYEILMHAGNYIGSENPNTGEPDSLGCILPGKDYRDVSGDGIQEILASRDALHKVMSYFKMEEEFKFIVTHEQNL